MIRGFLPKAFFFFLFLRPSPISTWILAWKSVSRLKGGIQQVFVGNGELNPLTASLSGASLQCEAVKVHQCQCPSHAVPAPDAKIKAEPASTNKDKIDAASTVPAPDGKTDATAPEAKTEATTKAESDATNTVHH